MKNRKRTNWICPTCVVLVMLLLGGCGAINETCFFGGCYGPFKLMIETDDGKVAEDVIVTVAYITGGEFGWSSTYDQTQVVKSSEPLTFPRGYVIDAETGRVPLGVYLEHVDYQQRTSDNNADFAGQPEGIIDLGVKKLERNESVAKEDYERLLPEWRVEGVSEKEIQRRHAKIKRTPFDRLRGSESYFIKATRIGRADLIDKYLPQLVKEYVEGAPEVTKSVSQMEEEYRNKIKKSAGVQ